MELKTPTKKGIKTPRYRPPLPMLNESCSGYCVDEYDWPQFSGYYNGTSVIVDDSQAITLLTNKGFFGKGSLSKGCPNVAKRKIPISVVYESQWKRRKMWMQSLNNLLETRKKSNETLEGNVVDIDNKKSNDGENMEVESKVSDPVQNNACETEQKSSKASEDEVNENIQNKSDETSKDNMVDIENKKSNEAEKNEIGIEKSSSLLHNSCETEEGTSKTSGNEGNGNIQNKSNETSQDNMVDIYNKKSNDEEKMEVDNENKNILQNNSCKIEEESSNGNENEDIGDSKKKSVETSKDNIVDTNGKKSDDREIIEIDNEENNFWKIDEEPNKTSENEDNGNSKSKSVETSKDNMVDINDKKRDDKEIINVDNNLWKIDEEPCKTNENEHNGNSKASPDMEHIIEKPIEKKEISDRDKNEKTNDSCGVIKDSTSSKVGDDQSKCVKKINRFNYTEKSTLNINEVLVIPDIDGDLEQYFRNLKPHIEEENVKTAIEVLYLSLEEAFFLRYACNCLQVYDLTSHVLPVRDMWCLFQESQSDFIEKYVAYHYFRAKGWVVKSGTKFGGDFLLYKKGPLYFHASYIVIVEVLKNDENSRNKTMWQKIIGMNRMAESANKEILICHILWPDVEEEKFNDPSILKEFGVSETLLRRWQATQEKNP
ncbi:unnamed protein product [Nezara viridula]|uniref:tRNA-intron lyase n=1 Tax=Nezara viridula TaxID=85310 RepID=A0A9P0HRS7_NEZVI|nr:unnamed protein product [Nezara viridula]